MRFPCPHCQALGRVRTSERMSPTVSWLYLQCSDLECGHSWRVDAEATVTISPSAKPSPQVNMPLSPHVRRGVLARMLELLPDGNHQARTPQTMDMFELDSHALAQPPTARPSG